MAAALACGTVLTAWPLQAAAGSSQWEDELTFSVEAVYYNEDELGTDLPAIDGGQEPGDPTPEPDDGTSEPGSTIEPDSSLEPDSTLEPGSTLEPDSSSEPGGETPEPGDSPGPDDSPEPSSTPTPDPADAMTDISEHWGLDAITYCLKNGYMNGMSATTFVPQGTVTRAQMVQVLYNMQDRPSTDHISCPFEDVQDHWALDSILWAYDSGVVRGTSKKAFSPDLPVTREQVATMLVGYHEYIAKKTIKTEKDYLWRFEDRPKFSSWAKKGISWASEFGVMKGISRSVFSPRKSCTRAELSQVIQNYTESEVLFPPPSPDDPDGVRLPSVGPGTVVGQPNSPLVTFTRLSPNHSGRRVHKIDTITIHCMAGNLSVESCGALFADPEYEASSNYGIGSDGRIALYVDERNRSWCSSSYSNDQRAVTIEVANIGGGPLWPVSNQAYNALIDLVTDICRRNGIKQLLWRADKNLIGQVSKQNMTVHRWFAQKSCPGEYLYNRHGDIAAKVNQRLTALRTRDGLALAMSALGVGAAER